MKTEEAVERLHARYCLTSGCEQYPSDPTCGLRKALHEFAASVREDERKQAARRVDDLPAYGWPVTIAEAVAAIRKGKP